ncbi:MAG: TorF family putative porin [Terricaulis sp.]
MRTVQKMLAGAMLMGAAISGVAHAEGTWSGNIALTTDYVFRGITQTSGNPAVQGGFDYVNGQFYAGTWASNVSFSDGPELDVYAGVTPSLGPVALNLGVVGYFYPGAQDDGAEFDYYEAKATATITPATGFSVTGSLYYSPDFFGETGDALYTEIAASYAASDALSISGAFGHQTIDDVNGPGAGSVSGDYNTWNLGVTYTLSGFAIDARYVDTDIDSGDDIATYAGTDETAYDSAFILTVKKTL